MINRVKSYISHAILALPLMLLGTGALSSCTDYLDKAPESDVSEADAFKNFLGFQGFTEEMYASMPDLAKGYWNNSWNWGEDEIQWFGCNYMMGYKIDQGDFWGWQREFDGWGSGYLNCVNMDNFKPGQRFNVALWPAAWYCVRKCNVGLQNIDKLTEGTQEERDLIKGQLLFFRAWYQFMWMQYLGGMPYIDNVLSVSEPMTLPRESYQACADKAAADFRAAADLLPIDWDQTNAGKNTLGKNGLRINKITALAYLGKNYLWAASPLMKNTDEKMNSNTNASTYDYDKDYAQKAADAFAEILDLVEKGQTQYKLVDFEHYPQIFWSQGAGPIVPGLTESILRTTYYVGMDQARWGTALQFGGKRLTGGNAFAQATANYVNYFGMANGLPLNDPESGFDKTHPWKDRDPRFYQAVVYDGVKVIKGGDMAEEDRYANLYTGGNNRGDAEEIRTGYMLYKFLNIDCNQYDDGYNYWSKGFMMDVPWLRLSDVYLMYAESCAALGGASSKSTKCSLSALDAVNKIRERAGVAGVNSKFTGDANKFMDEVRRERAVELAWEGHRFNDLRRWLLLDKAPYNVKTSQEFDRVKHDKADAKNSEVANFREVEILTRKFSAKHYWFPLKKNDVTIYPEMFQNPGW